MKYETKDIREEISLGIDDEAGGDNIMSMETSFYVPNTAHIKLNPNTPPVIIDNGIVIRCTPQ